MDLVLNLLFDNLDPKRIIFVTTKLESDVEWGLDIFFSLVFLTALENILLNSRSGWYISNLELLSSWVHKIAATTEKYCSSTEKKPQKTLQTYKHIIFSS